MLPRFVYASLILFSLASLVGCESEPEGPPTYPVSGVITLDGAPVPKGTIRLVSEEDVQNGVPSASAEIVDGKYQTMATAGKKKVIIQAPVESRPADVTGLVPTRETIPARYNDKSELQVEITEESPNQFDFPLKSS